MCDGDMQTLMNFFTLSKERKDWKLMRKYAIIFQLPGNTSCLVPSPIDFPAVNAFRITWLVRKLKQN